MIRVKALRKSFVAHQGTVRALQGIDLEVHEGEFCVLLGPSGCGKTTTLRCVAGLERPDEGEIEIGETLVSSPAKRIYVPTEKRAIGMVFQSYAIWPHMSVFQNVAFPLTQGQKRYGREVVAERVRRALRLVRLQELENRPATDLSGGQQQRVAMARALVTEPKILLMDEPLSNLDARLREQMRVELKKITRSIGVTALYVTHDQAEALSLGDKVCVMNEGEILQAGAPQEVYTHPKDLFVAKFVGEMNLIRGTVANGGQVLSPLGKIDCRVPDGASSGKEVTLAIRPEHLALLSPSKPHEHSVTGKIVTKNYLGDAALLEVEVNGITLMVKLPGDSDFQVGQQALVVLPPDRWHVYDS
jgi:iron(III) transport system ATP-binding protein